MATINYERMTERNKEARSYLEKAMEYHKDVQNTSKDEVFYNVREASILLEIQQNEFKTLQHLRVSAEENAMIREITAEWQSLILIRDRIVENF